MVIQAFAAWLHFASIFVTVAALTAELVLYRRDISVHSARLLSRIDGYFGIGAGAILITGLARVFWFGKGAAFYASSPLFWVKVGVFLLVALLSIPPTIHFIGWRGRLAACKAPVVGEGAFRRTRTLLWIEAALLLTLPLFAALMARGIGR